MRVDVVSVYAVALLADLHKVKFELIELNYRINGIFF